MIITIDGPSGTGKTTIAKAVAERLHLPYYDTGAMYRAVAWAILHEKIPLSNVEAIQELLQRLSFEIKLVDQEKHYFVGSVDVTEEIRTKKVNEIVSQVAAMPIVREALWKQQREFGQRYGAVFEGRDMGSVVFPQAELKIFLTARPEVRAERRLNELKEKIPLEAKELDKEHMMRELMRRDQLDESRELAPLKKPLGAIEIDTSNLTIEQVVSRILSAFAQKQKKAIKQMSPGWLKARSMPFLYRFVLMITWIIFKFFYRIKVYGLEHYYPGAALIAPNHTSFLDPPIIGISWPEEVHYLARETLFKNRFFGYFIRSINAHPVQTNTADVSALKTVLQLLSEGKKVVLFPEGTRSEGTLKSIKPGIGLLLTRSQSAIIPAYIQGSREIWGRDRKLPKLSGRVICVFGSPLLWESFAHLEKKEAQMAIAKKLEESILALKKWLEEGGRGIPP